MTIILELWNDIREIFRDAWSVWWGRLILAGVLAFVVLIGWAAYAKIQTLALHEGTVTRKDHEDMWIQPGSCIPSGKTVICTPTVVHPESWSVTIEGIDENRQQNARTVDVDQATFDRVKVGEHFKAD